METLVCLLVQASHGSEFGPVEAAQFGIKDDAKRRHHAVEICLFSPGPPVQKEEQSASAKIEYIKLEYIQIIQFFFLNRVFKRYFVKFGSM